MATTRIWDADNGVWQRIGGPPNLVDPTEPVDPVDGLFWVNPLDDGASDPPGLGSFIEIAYASFTAPVSITTSTAVTAITVVSSGNFTYDGAPIMVEFYSPSVQTGSEAAGCSVLINLWETNTDMGFLAQVVTPAASVLNVPVYAARRITPVAGTRNYNIRAFRQVATGTINAGTGAIDTYAPGFIRVSRA